MTEKDREWIYLLDEIILEYLTNDKSKYSLKDFYKNKLIPNYIENIDYKQVDRENELVKFCLLEKSEQTKRVAHNKKYYIVTKQTYNSLLERCKYITPNKNTEKTICDRLADELDGQREVCIKSGKRIDVLTLSEIIEVKKNCNLLSSIGQILYYSTFYPDRKKRIHLFNHKGKKDRIFEKICEDLDIRVTYE